mgnify:CR=1 FL=1
MTGISRRIVLAGLGASPLAMPGIIRAQSTSKPIKIGLLSDMSGPYRDVGGPGNRWAAELAIQDNGGMVLDRPITYHNPTPEPARYAVVLYREAGPWR